ncbi:MAG: hypothetical protein ACT4QE_11315 [Anaerolineales bacterium]
MQREPELQAHSIVLLGTFNPVLFHPAWFAYNNLISQPHADSAKVEIIHPKAAIFKTEWLHINVLDDRFHASTIDASAFESLRDLVFGVFKLLAYIPLRAMGLNREYHFRSKSEDTWHRVGHILAPKEHWKGLLNDAGTRSLTIEGTRPDGLSGYIRAKVEPSNRVKHGVFIEVNDHFDLNSGQEMQNPSTEEALEIITQHWEESLRRSDAIASMVASLGDDHE